jgi:hypothetical protein
MSTLTWSYADRIDSPAECIFNSSGSNLIQVPVDTAAQAMAAIAAARKKITHSFTATPAATTSAPASASAPASSSASASPATSCASSSRSEWYRMDCQRILHPLTATSSSCTLSKSHVILTFHVESQSSDPSLSADEVEYVQGKLHLVDLASEVRVTSKSSARDSAESAAINLSLHTLGQCRRINLLMS